MRYHPNCVLNFMYGAPPRSTRRSHEDNVMERECWGRGNLKGD